MSSLTNKVFERIELERDKAERSPVHDERTAAILGIALGISFTVCFVTGIWSHLLQHPPSWFKAPARPAGLYRITQGVHVATGLATIPLLLAKLWSVYPRLFVWPPLKGAAHFVERVLLIPLVFGTVFQVFSGAANIARWYPWDFFFPAAHYWMAWIVMGAILAHVGHKAVTTRGALRRVPPPDSHVVRQPPVRGQLGRRGFLAAAFGAAGLVTATTVGQTVSPLDRLVLFGPRRSRVGSQGLPVNRAASEAGVLDLATDPAYRLVVAGGGLPGTLALTVAQIEALPRRAATLPIACVEGWSASARWTGVVVRDLLVRAGLDPGELDKARVEVHSLEPNGLYARSTLEGDHLSDPDTMLALEVNGERLNLDHGYPVRLIAPNRPGVLQTKWVTRLVVR